MSDRGGRGFGMSRRPGSGTHRPTPVTNPWSTVSNAKPPPSISEVDGPVPNQRTNVSLKFTTYCVIAMGYKKNKPPPSKVVLIRHVFNIIRQADHTAAIIPYDKDNTSNSICHATHIPAPAQEFSIYFPEFVHCLKRFRTKCRITSSLPLWQIKSKIFAELQANNFWINPTSLKCHSSERCGFFMYAHPHSTQHQDFRKIFDPILTKEIAAQSSHEYDFLPEILPATNHGSKVSTKVLMLRTSPCLTSSLQRVLSQLYASTSGVNLGTLNRYKFVPITSDSSMSDEIL